MTSRKRSAKARQKAEFEAGFGMSGDLSGAFDRERHHRANRDAQHEAALRRKACESKNRYDSRAEAQAVIADCEAHGRRGLSCYRCPYCDGWHLTSHPRKPE